MAEIEVLILKDSVRYTRKSNDPTTSIDPTNRPLHKGITLEEVEVGIRIIDDGSLFTTVPWSMVRQVIYKPAPLAAKGAK